MRSLLRRLRDLFRRRSIAREFEEEMAAHLAELEARGIARGLSPTEAQADARREFGNVLQVREDLRRQAGFPSWDETAGDLRNAWRGIRRRPGLAAGIIGILALGLAATAVIHGLLAAVYLRPLPVTRPQELYAVVDPAPRAGGRLSRGTVRRLEELLPSRSVAAYSSIENCTVQIGEQPGARANLRLVNGAFFDSLGLNPEFGRGLTGEDDMPGRPANVVVVSATWAAKNFGSPEAALGREIIVNRLPVAIVGILPRAFRDVTVGGRADLWFATAVQTALRFYGSASMSSGDDRPNDPDWNREERISWLQLLVRAPAGETAARLAVQRAWAVQRDDLMRSDPDPRTIDRLQHRVWSLVASPGGRSQFRDGFLSTGMLFTGVVTVLLLLVCMNVSGLLLVRSMSRHREIGVRLAIGAGSFRVMRLSFMEALVLSVAGGAAGWLLADWLLPVAVRLLAPGQELNVTLGLQSLLIMTGLVLVVALLSALAPALWISRINPLQALSGSQGLGQAPRRLSRLLVVAQFALAVALVAVAASLGEELQRTFAADPGFARDHVITAAFDPQSAGYDDKDVPALLERMRTLALGVPGVQTVSFAANGIMAGSVSTSGLNIRNPKARVTQGSYQHDAVQPGFFNVVGTPILRGRDLVRTDGPDAQPVALVSASFARDVFGDLDPIGQTMGYDQQASGKDWTIVGVVPDAHVNGVREQAPAMFYLALGQNDDRVAHFMAVRFTGSPDAVQPGLRAALSRGEPGLVLSSWKTFEERITDNLSGDFATTHLAMIFGACAMLLAGTGIAASLGYLVVLRQKELALRLAIGATPARVLRGVLGDALLTSCWGGAAGLTAVWLVPALPAVQNVLHGRPGLWPALLAVGLALAAAALAAWIPARRAARIDPARMLKAD